MLPSTVQLCEALGFTFELDWDNAVIITPPQGHVTNRDVMAVLNQHLTEIGTYLHCRRKRLMRQFVGGPFNGQQHGLLRLVVALRVKRSQWAAYRLEEDGRAFYCGEATSEKKARALALAAFKRAKSG